MRIKWLFRVQAETMAAPAAETPVAPGEDEGFKWPTTFEEFSAMMVKVCAQ